MRRSWVQLLLLINVHFWTSGAAAYVHELTEHVHAPSAQPHASGDHFSKPTKPAHSEHDCPVCASLAALHLANVAPPIAMSAATPCIGAAVVFKTFTPSRSDVSLPQTRGPPALVRSLHLA